MGLMLEYQNEVGRLLFEEPSPFGSWEQQFVHTEGFNLGFYEFEPFLSAHNMSNMTSRVELNDFDEISGDLGLWDFDQIPSLHNDANTVNYDVNTNHQMITSVVHNNGHGVDCNVDVVSTRMYGQHSSPTTTMVMSHQSNTDVGRRNGRYKSSALRLEEIQKYFDVPITKAAKELNVGLTVLKKRCRELNITRWPHRKIKSLKSLIHNVKEMGLTNEIQMLEEHKRMVEQVPEMELTERTKKLRQACFKANYKKRRSMHQPSTIA